MYGYTEQSWFRVAEKNSRGQLNIADNTGFSDWIFEAGDAIMKKGKPEFQYIYQNYQNEANSWSRVWIMAFWFLKINKLSYHSYG